MIYDEYNNNKVKIKFFSQQKSGGFYIIYIYKYKRVRNQNFSSIERKTLRIIFLIVSGSVFAKGLYLFLSHSSFMENEDDQLTID